MCVLKNVSMPLSVCWSDDGSRSMICSHTFGGNIVGKREVFEISFFTKTVIKLWLLYKMASPFGYVVLATASNAVFGNAQKNDLLVYTSSNQSVYLGASNSTNFLRVTSNLVQIVGNLDFSGALTNNGQPFVSGGGGGGGSFTGSNLSVSGGIACGSLNISANVVGSSSPNIADGVSVYTNSNLAGANTGISSNEAGTGISIDLASSNAYMNIVYYNSSNAAQTYEVLRVNGAGNMGIGTTSPQYTLDVAGGTINANTMLYRSLQQVSDKRVKNTFSNVDIAWAEGVVANLEPVTFYFNGSTVQNVGFVAQDVESVCPIASRTVSDFVPLEGAGVFSEGGILKSDLPLVGGDVFKLGDGTVCTVESVLEDLQSFAIHADVSLPVGNVDIESIKVDDFKAIDLNALVATLVACTKGLLKRVAALETSVGLTN